MKTFNFFPLIAYISIVSCFSSCMNYYKISKSPPNNSSPDSIINNNSKRYFILRNGDSAYYMRNVIISADQQSLTCMLDTLPAEHKLHLTYGRGGHMRYEATKGQQIILNEVHVYIEPNRSVVTGSSYNLNFDKINKVEVLEKDKGRTTTSYILGAVGITIGTMAAGVVVAGVIVAAEY